jgi:hypothetical protein
MLRDSRLGINAWKENIVVGETARLIAGQMFMDLEEI